MWHARATWSTLYAPNAEERNTEDNLQCSITNPITLFHGGKYLEIATVLKVHQDGSSKRKVDGVDYPTSQLLIAMFEHTATMMRTAYKKKLTSWKFSNFAMQRNIYATSCMC